MRVTNRRCSVETWSGYAVEIRIDPHTLERAEERGTTAEETRDVIDAGFAVPEKYGRLGRGKIYPYQQTRHGRYCEQNRVEVFYAVEKNTVITVTVYVFYGKWDEGDGDSV